MNIHVLGSGAYPLRLSNPLSTSLLLPEHGLVIDAGLGLAALPASYTTDHLKIILSHFHHDHILGLAFLANFLEAGQCKKITIFGDERIQKLGAFFVEPFNPDYTSELLPITMELLPENSEIDGIRIKRMQVPHASGASNYFLISDSKKSFGFGTDTTANPDNGIFFKEASVLLHECNYDEKNKVRAIQEGHSYPSVVGALAKNAGVQRLYVIHHDTRYPDTLQDIQKTFLNSELASDGQIISI